MLSGLGDNVRFE